MPHQQNNIIYEVVSLLSESHQVEAVKNALSLLLCYYKIDWIYIGVFNNDKRIITLINEVASTYGKPVFLRSQSILKYDAIPWSVKSIMKGEPVIINDIEDLPVEAQADRKLFRQQNIKSTLMMPVSAHGAVTGFLGIDSIRYYHNWASHDVDNLYAVTNVLAPVIECKNKKTEKQPENKSTTENRRNTEDLKVAFLENLSHEIRTPLNAIVGFSNIIAETDDKEQRICYNKIVEHNSNLLLQILSDIIDASSVATNNLALYSSYVNVKELCSEVYNKYRPLVHDDVKFIFNHDEYKNIMLYIDAKRLMQVVSNLVSNAVKFTEKGTIELSYRTIKNRILISVSDTGIGIDPLHHDIIFERFTKLNNFSQGAGLGLSLCKSIIHYMNGEIGVDSSPDKGSTFWISLPLPANNSASDLNHYTQENTMIN